MANPGPLQRSSRHLRNFLNTFRDAINESMGMFLSRMKSASASMLFQTQDEQLKKLSTSVLSAAGSAYDPILECHISRRVVVELRPEKGEAEEYCGVLKEYSPAWLSVLDCRIAEERKLPLTDAARLKLQRDLDFRGTLKRESEDRDSIVLTMRVENHAREPVCLKRVESEGYEYPLNVVLALNESHEWTMKELPAASVAEIDVEELPVDFALTCPERQGIVGDESDITEESVLPVLPDLALVFESEREVDVYIPRTLGTLRHANEFIGVNNGE